MSKKKKRTVYSTNPDFVNQFFDQDPEFTPAPEAQRLRVWLDRIKGNKEVTRIVGFEGEETVLEELGKNLKKKCGTGGSVKDMEVLLQGDHRDKVIELLKQSGYTDVKKSGG
ncbi:translation initiation factor [Membranicola marinus]|uniref:Translation initiation factor n=1 Tax=Membranihabitans marinus TaxID=1227546 RepID=A0A953LD37_9BACT|nr:translation initiation factor [Membranihabitans marinus]MBY5958439.1 translation initiation factor [Membranihabitans marinus]